MGVTPELLKQKNGHHPKEKGYDDKKEVKAERTTRVMARGVEITPDSLSERIEEVLNILEIDWDQVRVELLTSKANKLVVQILGFPKAKYPQLISQLSEGMHFQSYTSESYQQNGELLIDLEVRPALMHD